MDKLSVSTLIENCFKKFPDLLYQERQWDDGQIGFAWFSEVGVMLSGGLSFNESRCQEIICAVGETHHKANIHDPNFIDILESWINEYLVYTKSLIAERVGRARDRYYND